MGPTASTAARLKAIGQEAHAVRLPCRRSGARSAATSSPAVPRLLAWCSAALVIALAYPMRQYVAQRPTSPTSGARSSGGPAGGPAAARAEGLLAGPGLRPPPGPPPPALRDARRGPVYHRGPRTPPAGTPAPGHGPTDDSRGRRHPPRYATCAGRRAHQAITGPRPARQRCTDAACRAQLAVSAPACPRPPPRPALNGLPGPSPDPRGGRRPTRPRQPKPPPPPLKPPARNRAARLPPPAGAERSRETGRRGCSRRTLAAVRPSSAVRRGACARSRTAARAAIPMWSRPQPRLEDGTPVPDAVLPAPARGRPRRSARWRRDGVMKRMTGAARRPTPELAAALPRRPRGLHHLPGRHRGAGRLPVSARRHARPGEVPACARSAHALAAGPGVNPLGRRDARRCCPSGGQRALRAPPGGGHRTRKDS